MKKIRIRDIEHQKSVQTLLFRHGYTWASGSKEIKTSKTYNFLLVAGNKTFIAKEEDVSYYEEVIVKESLSLIPVYDCVEIDGNFYSKEKIKALVCHENF